MAINRAILPWLLLAGGSLVAQGPTIKPVLKAELAFARMADQKGIRAAFLAWMTADARVFSPRMTSAKAQYSPEPGDPGHLAWYPEAMGMARSGDLAWSFGPWTYAVKKGEAVLVDGHYLSLWRRQRSGLWRAEADIGIPHAAPEYPIKPFAPWDAPSLPKNQIPSGPDATTVLHQKEADLSTAWAKQGGLALLPDLAQEARILRPRSFPARTAVEIRKILEEDVSGATWEPDQIQVASSGDLAWTCGETRSLEGARSASFLRIWTLEAGAWKVLFDVRLPHPASPR